MNSSTRSAEMDVGPCQVQIVFLFTSVQCDIPRGLCEHVFNQRAWKTNAAVVAKNCARLRQYLDARRRGLRQPDLFQRIKGGMMDT
jgi:hypothetical protein